MPQRRRSSGHDSDWRDPDVTASTADAANAAFREFRRSVEFCCNLSIA